MSDLLETLRDALAGRYAVERELGRGGMATVFLAEDLKHRRPVAIKVLHPELAAAVGAERFLREIEIAARLQHPHILPLYDSGAAGSLLYYVMPYVEGESLRDRLNREKQLGLEDAVRVTTEVAGALAYAHSHGVVHRDIKPPAFGRDRRRRGLRHRPRPQRRGGVAAAHTDGNGRRDAGLHEPGAGHGKRAG